MTIDDKIKVEKLRNYINREAAASSGTSSNQQHHQRKLINLNIFVHERNLSLEHANEKQGQLVNELKDMSKGKIPVEIKVFFKECRILY